MHSQFIRFDTLTLAISASISSAINAHCRKFGRELCLLKRLELQKVCKIFEIYLECINNILEFYAKIMARHRQLEQPYDPEEAESLA